MMILFSLFACFDLDGFVYNPVHCSTVDDTTCSGNEWDRVCNPCEDPYDWTSEYPWFEGQLADGQLIRPLPDGWVQDAAFETTDGEATLDAYFIPSHGEVPALAQTTVLYNHGNYAGIEHYRPRLRVLHELGYNVFVWDYRGFGKSMPIGAPSADEFLADARQAREVAALYAPDPGKIVLYGYSLGGVPAMEAAVTNPGCALVLEAPFTSNSAIARANSTVTLPETFFSSGGFDNLRKAEQLTTPLFAMSGTDDIFFPTQEVRRLHDASPGPKSFWELEGVGHGVSDRGIVEAGVNAYGDALMDFWEQTAPGCVIP